MLHHLVAAAVMAIASVIALAVVGTAGAFGYRALFGSSASSQPPPVIADAAPSKIVPAITSKDAQANKLITERIRRGQSENWCRARSSRSIGRNGGPVSGRSAIGVGQRRGWKRPKISNDRDPPRSTGGGRRDIPGGSGVARPPVALRHQEGAQPADNSTADSEADAAPTCHAVASGSVRAGNAPLSQADASPACPSTACGAGSTNHRRSTTGGAPASASGAAGGGGFVQVSSQRSEGEAQAAFRSLQAKYRAS